MSIPQNMPKPRLRERYYTGGTHGEKPLSDQELVRLYKDVRLAEQLVGELDMGHACEVYLLHMRASIEGTLHARNVLYWTIEMDQRPS